MSRRDIGSVTRKLDEGASKVPINGTYKAKHFTDGDGRGVFLVFFRPESMRDFVVTVKFGYSVTEWPIQKIADSIEGVVRHIMAAT